MIIVPKPNRSKSTTMDKKRHLNIKKVQFELICGFAATYLTNIYSDDWVVQNGQEISFLRRNQTSRASFIPLLRLNCQTWEDGQLPCISLQRAPAQCLSVGFVELIVCINIREYWVHFSLIWSPTQSKTPYLYMYSAHVAFLVVTLQRWGILVWLSGTGGE